MQKIMGSWGKCTWVSCLYRIITADTIKELRVEPAAPGFKDGLATARPIIIIIILFCTNAIIQNGVNYNKLRQQEKNILKKNEKEEESRCKFNEIDNYNWTSEIDCEEYYYVTSSSHSYE